MTAKRKLSGLESNSVGASTETLLDDHWDGPKDKDLFINLELNVLVFQLGHEKYTAVTCDADGIYGRGTTIDSALEDLRLDIEDRVERGGDGINTSTQSFDIQVKAYEDLVAYWKSDGIDVLSTELTTITLFAS